VPADQAAGRRPAPTRAFPPGRRFAREALQLAHGKTEAWIIIRADPGATVHVGFKQRVDLDVVRAWMRTQDSAAMLDAMHELQVGVGDAIFVPAGTPHAIGAGILLVELQEPTDLSITLEWTGFELGENDSHLNLGWRKVLAALDRSAWTAERIEEVRAGGSGSSLLPSEADPYFRAERVRGGETLDAGFSVLVGLSGSGTLGELPIGQGSEVLIPYGAGSLELAGDVEAIRCRPPIRPAWTGGGERTPGPLECDSPPAAGDPLQPAAETGYRHASSCIRAIR
jgi:mannose-6-phosphate isomerase